MMQSIARFLAPNRLPPSPLSDADHPMEAVVMYQHGPSSVLIYESSYPSPIPAPGSRQVVVEVVAAGINPVDFKMRTGPVADFMYPKPKIIGSDIAGIVKSAPIDSKFKVGDRVYSMLPLLGTSFGGYASQCCVEESLLAHAPENIDLKELASIPLVACTIVQALRPVRAAFGNNTQGKKCFIQAGSGGVGTFAIQYCANVLGMYVSTTCSLRNAKLLKSLGAKEIIDYTLEKIEDRVEDYDVFLDTMGYLHENLVFQPGSKILKRSWSSPSHYIRIASSPYGQTKRESRVQFAADPLGLAIPEARLDRMLEGYSKQVMGKWSGIRYHFILVHPDQAALEEVKIAMEEGKIRPVVQTFFNLQEASRAHDVIEEGHVTGKLVLLTSSAATAAEAEAKTSEKSI